MPTLNKWSWPSIKASGRAMSKEVFSCSVSIWTSLTIMLSLNSLTFRRPMISSLAITHRIVLSITSKKETQKDCLTSFAKKLACSIDQPFLASFMTIGSFGEITKSSSNTQILAQKI